jgi:two-component system LytT family sensor kinase
LEQIRFGSRLKFEIDVPENSENIFLPSLVLQTLVENAVKHGVAPSVDGGHVRVSVKPAGVRPEEPGYELCVGNSMACSSVAGTRTGLENTKARLDLLYGSRHGFTLQDYGPGVEARFWFSGESLGA